MEAMECGLHELTLLLLFQAYQARITNEEISNNLKMGLPPSIRSLFQTSNMLTELIPLLMRIITPPLKPVSLIHVTIRKSGYIELVRHRLDHTGDPRLILHFTGQRKYR